MGSKNNKDNLRERAEKIIDNQLILSKEKPFTDDELIHELRAHQIEL